MEDTTQDKTFEQRIRAVADDYEEDTLDHLLLKAGITWDHECSEHRLWTNREDDLTCGRCGQAR